MIVNLWSANTKLAPNRLLGSLFGSEWIVDDAEFTEVPGDWQNCARSYITSQVCVRLIIGL